MLKRNKGLFLGLLLILVGLAFVYREALFSGKVLFPSNLLASFYSPWSTHQFPGWGAGIPNKPIGGNDQVRLLYPARTFTNSQLNLGQLPSWNPYVFSGSPHLANFQSAVFYPLHMLYFLLPQISAWSILIVVPFVLGFIGMYIYLRQLKLVELACCIGAIAFSFSGFLSAWTQENATVGHAALWLPFILFGIEKLLASSKKVFYASLIAVFLACSFLSGFYQITFYIYAVTFFYGIFRIWSLKRVRLYYFGLLCVSFLFSLCLSAVQLIPSAQAFFSSARSSSSVWYLFDEYLVPLTHFVRLLIPDILGNPGTYSYAGKGFYHETLLYIGIAPLLFALFAFFKLQKSSLVRFFSSVFVVSLFFAIKSPFSLWFFKLPLPLITTFLPSRIFFITGSCLSILAAFGLSYFMQEKKYKVDRITLFNISFFCLVTILTIGALILQINYLPGLKNTLLETTRINLLQRETLPSAALSRSILKNMILPLVFLVVTTLTIVLPIKRKKIALGILLLTFISQFYFLQKYAVTGYSQFLYPEHFIFSYLQKESGTDRFLAFGRPILGNVAQDKKLQTPEGIDAVFPVRYGQLATAAKNGGKVVEDIPRIEVTLSELGLSETILDNVRRLRLMSTIGVKNIFFYNETKLSENDIYKKFPSPQFKILWSRDNWYAFENTFVLPRAFLVNNFVVKQDKQEIVDTFFDPEFDPAKTLVLEENLPAEVVFTNEASGSARIVSYAPTKIEIDVQTSAVQLLFLSDNYFPGWVAFVDGEETKLYRANYTFRAVLVPAGSHTVTFSYEPTTVKIGLVISFVSTMLLLLLIYFSVVLLGKIRKFSVKNRLTR